MKKILSILLVSLFVISTSAFALSAVGTIAPDEKTSSINNCNMLDFEASQNQYWAKYDAESDKWVPAPVWFVEEDDGMEYCYPYGGYDAAKFAEKLAAGKARESYEENPYDNDTFEVLSFMIYQKKTPMEYLNKLNWSLTDEGEVLHLEANTTGTAGIGFNLDDGVITTGFKVGSESNSKPETEYFKIRLRNNSSSSLMSFGFNNSNINSGRYEYAPSVSISNLTVEANSGEWQTIVFSMRDINSATNYGESLAVDANGIPVSRWGSVFKQLYIFPFGYGTSSSAYEGAAMDIDYIVMGSKEYVENYKSALELKEEQVSKIEITTAPSKTTYYVGETVDLEGLQLKVTFNDGTTETVSSASTIYNFDDAGDSVKVTLKYGSATADYNVKVVGIKSLEVETMPEKTAYKVTDVNKNGFTPTGLTVKATFEDDTAKTFTLSQVKIETDFVGSGTQFVTVNYHGVKTTFTINLINVTGIVVEPVEAPIYFGQKLSASDVKVTVVYSDESIEEFSESGLDANSLKVEYDDSEFGETTVTVTYTSASLEEDLVATTTGTYATPSELVVDALETAKKVYELEETFNPEYITLKLVYADGKNVVIPMDALSQEPTYDFSKAGKTSVTFTFGELTADFEVTVEGIETPNQTTKAPASTTATGNNSGSPVVIIVIVAVVVVAAVVVVVIIISKKKKK